MSTITVSNGPAASLRADALVVGVAAGERGLVLPGASTDVDQALGGRLSQVLTSLGATGQAEQVTKLATLGATRAPVLVAVGLGDAPRAARGRDASGASYAPEALRRAAGAAARALAGTASVGLALPTESAEAVAAVSEGALLGAYAFLRYRTVGDSWKPPVGRFTVVTPLHRDKAARAVLERARIVADAVHLTRDLVNASPADLRPAEFAAAAVSACTGDGVDVEVFDERFLRKHGFGGILGVGQGSASPPRLVRLGWRHRRAKRHVALVGKGITFDSGGLSLKPTDAMKTMKCDMGGAAAVIAATRAVARLGLPVNVTAWAPMAENMPSGTAQRPSDVLRIYGGKTVEVLNTDAEGRLILADALVRASEDRPDLILDIATLTGAAVVALGHRTAAIMANDEDLQRRVHDAAGRTGELMWPMPLPDELRKGLESGVADLVNIGERWGGALTAGVFLREFVGDGIPWAHIDIAGPAFNDSEPYGYTPKGGTGAGVRTLVRVVEDVAQGDI
jgi:leucyl aminopeptidase